MSVDLIEVICKDSLKELQLAFETGIDVNFLYKHQGGGIHYFCSNYSRYGTELKSGFLPLYRKHHGNVNLLSQDGLSPLYLAVSKLHFNLVVQLIELGADVNIMNQGRARTTALFHAVHNFQNRENELEMIKFLLKNGADPDLPNLAGNTPKFVTIRLHNSILEGHNQNFKDKDIASLLGWV